MKISNQRKNRRKASALQPTCPNCGKEGRHLLPRTLDEVLAGRRFFICDPKS